MPDTAGAPDSSNGRFTCCNGVLCLRPGWHRSAGKPVPAIGDAGNQSGRSSQAWSNAASASLIAMMR